MKTLIFIFYSVFCLNVFCQQKTPDAGQVIALMKTQELAWNAGDINGFMKYYWHNDSLTFIGSKGLTYGWQKTLDNYLKSYPSKEAMGILNFTIIQASVLSDTIVYIIGKWELKKAKPVGGHFTLLWKKIDGNWVIVADHTS